jgi:hypothetical protein
MARKFAEMDISLQWLSSSTLVVVRTIGSRSTLNLNDINKQAAFMGHPPLDTSANFYHQVLTWAATMF